jgi:ketol-acid reductoisomerase
LICEYLPTYLNSDKEVFSDLTGERGVLMGAIQGMFRAQYEVLRKNGHSPSEAFNETVEEATQSLYPLIGAKGMDWMYDNCSTTVSVNSNLNRSSIGFEHC